MDSVSTRRQREALLTDLFGAGDAIPHEMNERLYPIVSIGTPGEFTYQTVKVGRMNGAIYAESHEDIYGKNPAIFRQAMGVIEGRGLATEVDQKLLLDGLGNAGGVPFQISPGAEGASLESY